MTVGGDLTWEYGTRGLITLEKDLPNGWGLYVEVALQFSVEQLNGEVMEGTRITLDLYPFAQAGDFAGALWEVTGNLVLNTASRLLCVPELGLRATVLSGSALIERFTFPTKGDRPVYGLLPLVARQQITLDGNGSLFYRGTGAIPNTEALRALVSCEVGYSHPSPGRPSPLSLSMDS